MCIYIHTYIVFTHKRSGDLHLLGYVGMLQGGGRETRKVVKEKKRILANGKTLSNIFPDSFLLPLFLGFHNHGSFNFPL
jgi:hypothetical protein